jgi:MFS family permease
VWSGESISMIGDTSYEVTFAWLVLSLTHSPAILGAVMVATTVPSGVLLLVGGAITDWFSPRIVMLFAHLVRGAAVGVLTVLAITHSLHLWEIYPIGIVVSIGDAFFWPASDSILPSLVATADLPRANALLGTSGQVARLVGPLLGGALVTLGSTTVALGFNAITFFVAATTVAVAPRQPSTSEGPSSVGAIMREIRSGLSYAGRNVEVRLVLLLVSASTLTYSGLFAVGLPALAQRFPHGPAVLAAMVAAWGLGQLIGTISATITGLPKRWGLLIIGMAIIEGISYAVLGLVPQYLLAVALLAFLGIGVAYSSDVALPTFVQTRTPAAMLGRVNSVISLPRVVLTPVSVAVIGVLATASVGLAFMIAAIPMLLAGIVLALSPTARRLSVDTPRSSPERVAGGGGSVDRDVGG